jgi:hypothetical protein
MIKMLSNAFLTYELLISIKYREKEKLGDNYS